MIIYSQPTYNIYDGNIERQPRSSTDLVLLKALAVKEMVH